MTRRQRQLRENRTVWRLKKAGSGLLNSDEFLIADLDNGEFDLLFYDEHVDEDRQDLNLVFEAEIGDPEPSWRY